MSQETETILKMITLGSSDVGKTSILNRYFNSDFTPNLLTSIGIDFKTKIFKFDGKKVKFNFVDTAGQEKFRAISSNYLKGTDGILFVFDIANIETFELIQVWIEEINENNRENVGIILFGNKLDLEKERQVSIEDAEKLSKELGCKYFEGSAKIGENIQEALDELAKISFEKYKTLKGVNKGKSIKLTNGQNSMNDNDKSNKNLKKKKFC